ncbi:aminotransferase [Oxalicibacterium flavum]|uniref:Aminotransferase n=1 Tax=Oxalicibacterium flavum TaxID=179467 RepID=A0A8J2XWZ1_9BURK|nr:methionine aminotransferase [Oxalicibacterium flavum]GGC02886.1 aminotransferase [Oxalicibacterium flavum]
MIQFDSKLPHAGTTIFTHMTVLAQQANAVNLGQGFPDFDCDPELLRLMQEALQSGHNQYAPMAGVPALREAVAQQIQALYGRTYDPGTEITITAGATQAIHAAISALVRPGDEVILFEPAFDSYEPAILLNGGKPVPIRLRAPDYRPDWDAVLAALSPRTRAILINSPHNPTARLWTAEDMQMLAEVLRDTNVVVISDEVYEHMVFDGKRHESVARYPELAERSYVVSSFGKAFHITGWKIAYCLAPRALMAEFQKAHQFIVFCTHAPSQHALAQYLPCGAHLQLAAFYQQKRDLFVNAVANCGLRWLPSEGSYFVSASFAHLPVLGEMSSLEFSEWLTREIGVACIPLSAFYHDGFDEKVVRFCFAKREDTLHEAARRLQRLSER